MLGLGNANRSVNALISSGGKVISSRGKVLNLRAQNTDATKFYSSRVPLKAYTLTRGAFGYKNDFQKILFFQFNPEKISDSKEVEYASRSKPGQDYSDPIWIKGGARTLSFELVLDATQGSNTSTFNKPGTGQPLEKNPTDFDNPEFRQGAVSVHNPNKGTLEQVEFIQSLLRPDTGRDLEAKFAYNGYIPTEKFFAPPEIVFSYGPLYLEGVLEKAEVEHELFSGSLAPLRSRVSVNFRVIESQEVVFNDSLLTSFEQISEDPDFDTLGGQAGFSSPNIITL